jgi:L-rhamnose isomerase
MEESKTLPVGAVWQEFCHRQEVPSDWMAEVRSYERDVLSKRVG